MKAVMDFKASTSSKLIQNNPSTPPRPSGEVLRSNEAVSPTEVNRVTDFLKSKNINRSKLRQIESLKPGGADAIMKIATQLALGQNVQQPRFGIMGKIVQNLRLFEDESKNILSERPQISNNYHAPVQVFNGPVFFGSSSDSLLNCPNKRPRAVQSDYSIRQRRLEQTKEETFFS